MVDALDKRSLPTPAALAPPVAKTPFELQPADRATLRAVLAQGSKSFSLASKLLPRRMRDAVLVYYAYCRHADDAIDESPRPKEALARLTLQLESVFAGQAGQDLVSRELARLVSGQGLSIAPFQGLLEGFAWDTQKKTYQTLDELESYCARVAATVGITMTELMGPRERQVLARAADLGVAMQLTNIARDIGSDARAGRLYIPQTWMREQGLCPQSWMAAPRFCPAIAQITQRLLARAQTLYRRCESGIPALPQDCRASIYAARLIYADIGRIIETRGYDSVSQRAYVGTLRKLWLLLRSKGSSPAPSAQLQEPPLAATDWLCGPSVSASNIGQSLERQRLGLHARD